LTIEIVALILETTFKPLQITCQKNYNYNTCTFNEIANETLSRIATSKKITITTFCINQSGELASCAQFVDLGFDPSYELEGGGVADKAVGHANISCNQWKIASQRWLTMMAPLSSPSLTTTA
jgi:hypothetical protein